MAIFFDSETTDSLQHYEEGTFTLELLFEAVLACKTFDGKFCVPSGKLIAITIPPLN